MGGRIQVLVLLPALVELPELLPDPLPAADSLFAVVVVDGVV